MTGTVLAGAIDAVAAAAVAWVDLVRRRAATVLALVAAVTGACGYLTVAELTIDTAASSARSGVSPSTTMTIESANWGKACSNASA